MFDLKDHEAWQRQTQIVTIVDSAAAARVRADARQARPVFNSKGFGSSNRTKEG
jgi:hypothetical protein